MMGYIVITWEISKLLKVGYDKSHFYTQLYAKEVVFSEFCTRCSNNISICLFFISNTLTLTSLLLETYCIFPRALSPCDSGGLMQGGFLKLTLETTEVDISTGSAVASPSVWIVSSRRLWAALTLLKSPCAARMFRWARE